MLDLHHLPHREFPSRRPSRSLQKPEQVQYTVSTVSTEAYVNRYHYIDIFFLSFSDWQIEAVVSLKDGKVVGVEETNQLPATGK